ncbi:MAG: hypothetical protein Q9157_007271 [Trypethelium eluteriae]
MESNTSLGSRTALSNNKRSRSEIENEESKNGSAPAGDVEDASSEDDDMGPTLPSAAPKKKRRKLPYEKLYIAALPASPRYSKSLMHKEQLSFTTFTPYTNFLITSSVDGVVKFWKKSSGDVEFVKEFKAHNGEIRGVSSDNSIRLYDGRGEQTTPLHTISGLHRKPVSIISFNNEYDCVISVDKGGMIEYWRPSDNYEKPDNVFDMKSATNLFEFKKAKSVPTSITFSPTGHQFATFSFPDRKVRVFDFATGKLHRTYDESLATLQDMQQASTDIKKLDEVEFGRRLAVEKELDNPAIHNRINVMFDETGNFIFYGSLLGTKVINTLTNRVIKTYGFEEPFRPLNLSLYQGQPEQKGVVTVEMAASNNPLLKEAEARDAMLVATGSGKVRFYLFTNEIEVSKSTRDVHNERQRLGNAKQQGEAKAKELGSSAVVHTTYGDIHLRLFPDAAPKAVENFVTHSRSGYYNDVIFHRVIRKFMIQTGDPMGDGTGGESIWGKEFEDEFSTLKHDKPYTLSMANAGPNTNGSQFFITTERTPWLDNKHTIFGRAIQGLDVVHQIENARTYKEKPMEDIKIINISVA